MRGDYVTIEFILWNIQAASVTWSSWSLSTCQGVIILLVSPME